MTENLPGNQGAAVREVEVAQMPHELPSIYRWVTRDVLGSPPILDQGYLDELKLTGVIFGGGDLERRYRVEAARPGDWVCYLNLDHPTVPNWLWVNEVIFTEFRVRVSFSGFQQRLLNRASVAPSQLHPNAWSAIRCFELVNEFLELPQDPEVFLYLFTFFSPNTEDFPVGEHRPFWMSFEGQGRFPPYWSRDAGMEHVPITYKGLSADQKDTADILVKLFSERNLKPKSVLGSPSEAREAIVEMAGNDVTLERLRHLLQSGSSGSMPVASMPIPSSSVPPLNVQPASTSENQEETPSQPLVRKRRADDAFVDPKRPRVSEGTTWEFCSMDPSFDASGFIESNLLGPRAQKVLKDYDPMESIRWAEWASLQAAIIMKSIEPCLTAADQWENRCAKLNVDLKALNLQKVEFEKGKAETERAELKAEEDLKSVSDSLKTLEKEKILVAKRQKGKEAELDQEIQGLRKSVSKEKARADKAEVSLAELEKGREELIRMARDSIAAPSER
ncbi:hypothetical protein PIB30_020998 [Stylosanthes scabra]|uniref:Uncharacterized protein n=1 Tax=Stylosanthes scabra TaxID=79078 RepID=A0ABU6TAQ8_9FABA|nr:hypothetical protein [Stylosanthes scabra]